MRINEPWHVAFWAVLWLAAIVSMFAFTWNAQAHDHAQRLADAGSQWIQDQNLMTPRGEPCCGFRDCDAVDPKTVREVGGGYVLDHGSWTEAIPYQEVRPLSPDGKLWICRNRAGGERRCVFGPPWQGM